MFYPCKNHNTLNGMSFDPETVSGRVMVNPHYQNISLWAGTREIMIDSGAFQERDMIKRVRPDSALARQTGLMSKLMYQKRDINPKFLLVIYDQLVGVDEALVEGKRIKKRGTAESAIEAVKETLMSANFYNNSRKLMQNANIAFSAQGVTLEQYYECAESLVNLMQEGDVFAFGGFCILGRMSSLFPQFKESVRAILPLLKRKGVGRMHLLGVGVHTALTFAYTEAAKFGIEVTTDGSYVELNSVHGKVWDLSNRLLTKTKTPWRRVFGKNQKKVPGGYHPCELAMDNIRRFTDWTDRGCPDSLVASSCLDR